MAGYLRRYVGTYAVRAEYDEDTNDFPRLLDGIIDPSFDDYYIDCYNGIKIRHATGSTLSCYIPSVKRGVNIVQDLVADVNIEELEILDGEVYFTFPASDIDKVAKLCKAKTRGKNIQPLSPKTLPKRASIVPNDEMKRYKKLFNGFEGEKIKLAQIVMGANKEFGEKISNNYKQKMKELKLDFRSYVWHCGKWNEYIEFLSNCLSGK